MYSGQFVTNPGAQSADSTNKLIPASSKDGRAAHDQVTPLAARLQGTYTVVSAMVRLYAAYHLRLAPVYQMALWTYVVALAHFASELLVYRTARPAAPVFMPFLFASTGIVWMLAQYDFYVEA